MGRLYVDNRVALIEMLKEKKRFTINEVRRDFGDNKQLGKTKSEEYTVREYIEGLEVCFIVEKEENGDYYNWIGG